MAASAPVLVVGAGPTGMTAAIELARRDVPVRIVDREPGPVEESRALAVQPRTLEVWLDQGVAQRALEQGIPIRAANLHLESAGPVSFELTGMGGPFDAPLILPQDETEAILVERLAKLGVEVERETTLEGLHQVHDVPEAQLASPEGQESVQAPWVVAADGAHSTVREQLDLPFEGEGYPERFAIADVDADTDLSAGEIHAWMQEGRILLVVPLRRPGHVRVITTQREDVADPDRPPEPARLQALVDEMTEARIELDEPRWSSVFRVHCRGVPRYREDRVLLAGDAAHIHSPVGGQGMNTGIQDAHNLGWKLALVDADLASPGVLDTYHGERHPVGERLLRTTDRLFQLARAAVPAAGLARRWLVRPLLATGRVQRRLKGFVSQRNIRYHDSRAVGPDRLSEGGPSPGEQAPDAPVDHEGRRRRLLEVLADTDDHVVLIFEGTRPQSSPSQREAVLDDLADRWPGWLETWWTVVLGPPPPLEPALADPEGELHEAFGRGEPGYEVLRPDGHVGARADGFGLRNLDAYVGRLAEA